jgi:hypothetical protein
MGQTDFREATATGAAFEEAREKVAWPPGTLRADARLRGGG